MVRKKKMRMTLLLTATMLLAAFAGSVNGQLLFREGMEEENYARTGYNQYGRTIVSRSSNPRYDYFGNYILNGVSIFYWNEEKNNTQDAYTSKTFSELDKLNLIDESPYFTRYLDEFVVMSETNKSFSSRFIVGSRVRAKFSPLTLNMTTLNGIRWDTNFANNNFTVIASRASVPMWNQSEYNNELAKNLQAPVYLHGGHFERTMGLFNVSANYVNTYRSNSATTRSNNSLTGTHYDDTTLRTYRPRQLAVKVEDGSRYDGGGPRIYDIYPVINGVERPDLFIGISKGNWKDDFLVNGKSNNVNANLQVARYKLDPPRVPDFFHINSLASTDDPADYNILARRKRDEELINFADIPANEEGKNYLECNGEDYLVFWFDLPTPQQNGGVEIEEVIIKSLCSNNYIFSVSEIYQNANADVVDATTEIGKVSATYFEKVYYSKGDIQDESNYGWISFEHGAPMANMLMSMRVDAEFKGFKFVSEYSKNLQFKQYRNNNSNKFSQDAEAYFINVQKEFGKFTLGTEYFKMDPNYSTTFNHTDPYYAQLESAWGQNLYLDPVLNDNISRPGGPESALNLTNMIETVEDNDDKDQYPDYHMFRSLMDLNGVYPGLDENGNNRPDTNENDNIMPDYDEPFFLYSVDPDEYDYGLDLNNNSTIDVRENDTKPDYPYDVDRKGYHIFGSFGEDVGWKYTLGYLNMEKIAAGGETDVKYGIAEYNKYIPFFADMHFATTFKKVEDTIEDNVLRYARHLSTTLVDSLTYGYNTFYYNPNDDSGPYSIVNDQISEKYYDPLLYRDSYVTKSYFETNIFTIPNFTIGMKLKYDLNHQNKTAYQDENDLADRTQVYRAEYKYYLRDLLIQPQVKYLTRKYSGQDIYTRPIHEQYFYPIIRVEYPLTMRTTFKAGMQGLPGLNAKVKNLVNDQLDYDMRNLVVMLTNRSFYSGYDFSLNLGYESRWQSFNGVARQAYSRTDRFYFVRLVVGLEPIS